MSEQNTQELENAVRDLEQLGAKGRPDRYQARALLIALGQALLADPNSAETWVARTHKATAAFAETWEGAVLSELSLACAEHVHAVDPRYLDLPNYDFAYTLRARERLEERLVAAQALDIEVPETLSNGVERADRLLAPHVQRQDAKRE